MRHHWLYRQGVFVATLMKEEMKTEIHRAIDATYRMSCGAWKGRISPDELDALYRVLCGDGTEKDIAMLGEFGVYL